VSAVVEVCGPKWPGCGLKTTRFARTGSLAFGSAATVFACGAGDGNRTRTVSLGTVWTHGGLCLVLCEFRGHERPGVPLGRLP